MWNYAIFIPAALALGLLALQYTAKPKAPSFRSAGLLCLAAWLLSWTLVVVYLYSRSSGRLSESLVFQRELGYWSGSALFMAIPFVAVLAAGLLLGRTNLAAPAKRAVALTTAGFAWVFTPWLFFAGWVMGCVAVGYPSCM